MTDLDSKDSPIKDRERGFHDKRFGSANDPRSPLEKYYSITTEPMNLFQDLIRNNLTSQSRLLEYGCGMGESAVFYASLDCDFFGLDISFEAIRKAEEAAREFGFQATYLLADAECTGLADRSFDVVSGSGILHHLDLDNALSELQRITKNSGCCVFTEPLGHNPLIKLYRTLTPGLRSSDEHPLVINDFLKMKKYFREVDVYYFRCFSIAAVPFLNTPMFDWTLKTLSRIDDYFMKTFDWFGKYCWICVIRLGDPIRP